MRLKDLINGVLGRFGYEVRSKQFVGSMEGFLQHLMRLEMPCTTILDVGANRGTWSELARRAFPGAAIYMVEPQPAMERHLKAFCERDRNARYWLAGAAAQSGSLELTIWGSHGDSSSFLPGLLNETVEQAVERLRIPVLTLDSLLDDGMPMPQLVKLDVEGFELEALEGATRLWGHVEVFILEAALFRWLPRTPLLHEVVAVMAAHDYLPYDFASFVRRPLDNALGRVDICFAKKQGVLRAHAGWERGRRLPGADRRPTARA